MSDATPNSGPRQTHSPTPAATRRGSRSRFLRTMAIAVCFGLAVLFVATRHRLHSAEVAFSSGEFREALRQAEIELRSDPNSSQALVIAGLAARELNQHDVAIRYLSRVPIEENENTTQALFVLANYSLQQARAGDAERMLRHVLELDPDHFEARDKLIYLLVLQARTWEAQQSVLRALQSGRVDFNHLIVTGTNRTELGDSDKFTQSCLAVVPNDLLPLLPEVRRAYKQHELQRARELAERITLSRPENFEAQALLGTLLVENEDSAAFLKWHSQLPAAADDHPGIWFARGSWALQSGQREGAVRCFGEVLSRQPSHISANHQLSQLLAALGDETRAVDFGNRASDLVRLETAIRLAHAQQTSEQIPLIVRLLESMGRIWEAAAWCQIAMKDAAAPSWPTETLWRLQPRLMTCRTLTLDSANLVSKLQLTNYPLPSWSIHRSPSKLPESTGAPVSQVVFTEESGAAGFQFTYRSGASAGDSESIFEMDGGGTAVLDYDGDHWPDLYLTQGGPLPNAAVPRADEDRLFRNLGNGRFLDVTSAAGLNETAYGQGVTVGDVNNDGFPDLYVANIGPNSLFLNNGDGTFTDATQTSGTAGAEWTSSCVLVDVNGDTFPDVYAVNYVGGKELWSRVCLKSSPNRCTPDQFPSEPDRLYLNSGDGRFEDVTDTAGIVDTDGRGLGIIAADFDDSHRISLFVGNDMSRNFFFVNQTATRGAAASFSERALLQGLAVDSRGVPKASMGIAAGDANGDGLFDLFITNFYRESNNLYLQHPDHTFSDDTRAANLAESGFYLLGWGTQFLDGELDGFPDLILTNGHVHKPSDSSIPHRMPPQYYRNLGNGRFAEIPATSVGKFFQGKYLGRSLARLDWNRDGLEEACISHLDSPAALLLNRTPDHGHFLAVHLVGVQSDRDAIGTKVDIVADGHPWSRQLTAGDGYQASNERRLVFGLGAARKIERLDVHWPAGGTQTFANLPLDREFVVIEGRLDAVEILP